MYFKEIFFALKTKTTLKRWLLEKLILSKLLL